MPFGTSSIGRSYSTLNRFLLNDILSPTGSSGRTTSNQLEVPDASTTYRSSAASASASYRAPSTTSMLFGSLTSTRAKRSSGAYDKIKSSSSFRRSSDKYSSGGYREETSSLTSRFPTSTSLASASAAATLSSPISTGRGRGLTACAA